MNENNLENKNCLITGATGGLGINLAKVFLKNNCNISIIINSSSTPRIQEAHRTIYHIICEQVEKEFEIK